MAHDVFICHSSKDRTIANAVCAKLEQHHVRCWIAPRDIVPGRDYAECIIEALNGTALVLLVFSDSSNRSQHVHREVERAVNHGVPILPFRVEDVLPSPSLEYFISSAHWLDAVTPPVEQHLDHLVGTVQLLLARAGPPTDAASPETALPAPTPTPTPAPTPARRRLPWVVGAAAAGVLLLVVVAALALTRGGGGTTKDDNRAAPTASSSSTPAATTKRASRLGEALTLNGMDAGAQVRVAVLKVMDPATPTESFDTPAPGSRFVAVQVTITSTGTTAYDDSPDNCTTVVDRAGRSYEDATLYAISGGELFPATLTLKKGESRTAFVVFEVPMGARLARVQFAMDSGYADDVGSWPLP